jgi:hypothetical protein
LAGNVNCTRLPPSGKHTFRSDAEDHDFLLEKGLFSPAWGNVFKKQAKFNGQTLYPIRGGSGKLTA